MEDTRRPSDPPRSALLSDPRLRASLVAFFRRRVPASEVEDLAQVTLTEALAARVAPGGETELRRWVHGIARHKAADFHRQHRPLAPLGADTEAAVAESSPVDARDLLNWAAKELPAGHQAPGTLEWMLREGDGERLEAIAEDEQLPAPRVRQRIARLRKHFRARWAAALAAAGTVGLLLCAAVWISRRVSAGLEGPPAAREPTPPRFERARELRRLALEECRRGEYDRCLEDLDRAQRDDPRGDAAAQVTEARRAALSARRPAPPVPSAETPAPPVMPRTAPTQSAMPRTTPAPTSTPPNRPKAGPGKRPGISSSFSSEPDFRGTK